MYNKCIKLENTNDGFEEWLNRGEANNSVYKGISQNGARGIDLGSIAIENFIVGEEFGELGYAQQYLLEAQLSAMLEYEKCLKARLDCW